MTSRRTPALVLSAMLFGMVHSDPIGAISIDSFGPNGEGGRINGQTFEIGTGGAVEELDAFLAISSTDLNGGRNGISAQLSIDPLPAGLELDFSSALSADSTDLILSYRIGNQTGVEMEDVVFFSFLDAEIDEPLNTFFNEYAVADGTLATGQSFEVDEPGWAFGDVFTNLEAGSLDGTNAVPFGSPEDVSMAISLDLGSLAAGQEVALEIMISEDGDAFAPFRLTQHDADPRSETTITYSGRIAGTEQAIPEPGGALLFLAGFGCVWAALRRPLS